MPRPSGTIFIFAMLIFYQNSRGFWQSTMCNLFHAEKQSYLTSTSRLVIHVTPENAQAMHNIWLATTTGFWLACKVNCSLKIKFDYSHKHLMFEKCHVAEKQLSKWLIFSFCHIAKALLNI